jgi:transcriptional regulator with PAS, ATPase and Fis domain
MENGSAGQRTNSHSKKIADEVMRAMEKESSVIVQVEDFIKRIHDGDLVVTDEAKTLTLNLQVDKVMGIRSMKCLGTLADLLGKAMACYQFHRDDKSVFSVIRTESAYDLLNLIERARAYNVIKEVNVTNKLTECQEQNQRLKDNQQKLETEILRLKRENEELHKALDLFGGRSDVAGDDATNE